MRRCPTSCKKYRWYTLHLSGAVRRDAAEMDADVIAAAATIVNALAMGGPRRAAAAQPDGCGCACQADASCDVSNNSQAASKHQVQVPASTNASVGSCVLEVRAVLGAAVTIPVALLCYWSKVLRVGSKSGIFLLLLLNAQTVSGLSQAPSWPGLKRRQSLLFASANVPRKVSGEDSPNTRTWGPLPWGPPAWLQRASLERWTGKQPRAMRVLWYKGSDLQAAIRASFWDWLLAAQTASEQSRRTEASPADSALNGASPRSRSEAASATREGQNYADRRNGSNGLEGDACAGAHIFAAVQLSSREVDDLVELGSRLAPDLHLARLPDEVAIEGVVATPTSTRSASETSASTPPRSAASDIETVDVEQNVRRWVVRALSPAGLGLCPYTASDTKAAVRLESAGINPAPILHSVSSASNTLGLLADFWRCTEEMLSNGQDGTSSILLAAPHWDARWDQWRDDIFPLLEESVLTAGISRTIGIVCFHPEYAIPSPRFLAAHRFGHMHSLPTLRRWMQEHEPDLSEQTDDEELAWAGAYMRRSPHALINVLWAEQLAVAETKRKSSLLYAQNMARCLQHRQMMSAKGSKAAE